MTLSDQERPAAVLVAVQLPGVDDVEHAADLAELGRLVHTLGFDVVGTVSQRRSALAAGAVLGQGKLKQLAQLTGGSYRETRVAASWEAERGGQRLAIAASLLDLRGGEEGEGGALSGAELDLGWSAARERRSTSPSR